MPEDEIKRCYIDQNMTMSETAKKLNINLSVLHKYIVSHGLVKDTEDRKSTRLNSSHNNQSRMPSSA